MRWIPPPSCVVDVEVLEVVECSRLEPVVDLIELTIYNIVLEVDVGEVERRVGPEW